MMRYDQDVLMSPTGFLAKSLSEILQTLTSKLLHRLPCPNGAVSLANAFTVGSCPDLRCSALVVALPGAAISQRLSALEAYSYIGS